MNSDNVEKTPSNRRTQHQFISGLLMLGGLIAISYGVYGGLSRGTHDASAILKKYDSLTTLPWGFWNLQILGQFLIDGIFGSMVAVLLGVLNIYTILGGFGCGIAFLVDHFTAKQFK
jgi:hypothetical protein